MKIQYKLLASASIALFTIIRTDRNMLLACYSHKHISYRIRTIIRKAIIRGLKLIEPLEANLGGPGILCKRLNITKQHNKQDLTISHEFCVYESYLKPDYICTPRIGISKGQEKFWRFKIF